MTSFSTPVALFIYNRIDTCIQVLNILRQIRPSQIFVVADGPRSDKPGDFEKCTAVRAQIDRRAKLAATVFQHVVDRYAPAI